MNITRIRIAGERTSQDVPYAFNLIRDFSPDFERYGHLSDDRMEFVIYDAAAKDAFLRFVETNEILSHLVRLYQEIGILKEEDLEEIFDCEEVHGLPFPDQDAVVYERLLKVIRKKGVGYTNGMDGRDIS